MVVVSLVSARTAGVSTIMVRLHAPESLELDRGDIDLR